MADVEGNGIEESMGNILKHRKDLKKGDDYVITNGKRERCEQGEWNHQIA